MTQVIKKADEIARERQGRGLEELFDVSHSTFEAVLKLIDAGWYVFMAVVALLLLGWFGFLASLVTFLLTPIGLVVAAIFGVAAAATIKTMYREKVLPITVKNVGEKYKSRWEAANGNPTIIDGLLNSASNDLYERAISGMARELINR